MKRDFLKDLGLEADVVNRIMDEAGRDAEASKTALDDLKQQITAKDTEITGLRQQITQRDSDIDALKKGAGDIEAVKQDLANLQTKYKTDTDAMTKKLADQQTAFDRQRASEKFFADVKFSSGLARQAAIAQFDKDALELKDGAYIGAKEWLEKLKKDSPDAFAAEPEPKSDPDPYKPTFTKPIGTNDGQKPAASPFGAANFTAVRNPDRFK